MPVSKSIERTLLINTIVIITVTVAALGYLFISNEQQRIARMAEADRTQLTAIKKAALKDEALIIIDRIQHVKQRVAAATPAQQAAARADLLQWINGLLLGKNQYIVVNTFDGTILAHYKQDNIGKNMWAFTDANGVKAVQEVTRTSRQPNGGFVSYVGSIRPSTGAPGQKITYAKSIPDWEWVVATGVYLDDIEEVVTRKQHERRQALRSTILRTLLVLALAVGVAAVFVRLTVGKIMMNLRMFTTFFTSAAGRSTEINSAQLHFKEFQDLATPANRMIAERIRTQGILERQQEHLEEAVAARTKELKKEVERHRITAEELAEREATLASIFRAAPTGIGMVVDRVIIQANDRLCEMTGLSREEMIGKSARILYPDDAEHAFVGREKYRQIQEKGTGTVETRWQRKDGEIIDVLLSSTPIDPGDLQAGVTFTALDITATRDAMRDLSESEERYRQLFDMEMDAIFLIDKETGRILEANAAAESLYGYSRDELLSMKNTDLSVEPEKTTAATHSGRKTIPIRRHRAKDGTPLPVEITARHFVWKGREVHVAAIRDIRFRIEAEAERERLQGQLLQAQKMEAIGTLAGGIAHDFNNLLMGILGRVSLMKADAAADAAFGEHLDGINSCVVSATDLTKQLLGVARGGKYEVQTLDVNALAEESLTLFARTRKEIRIVYKLAADLKAVDADRAQINQVMLNLFVNAWQAMPEGGEIVLQTENVSVDADQAEPLQVSPGRFVKITVTDNGIGMPPEIRQRIFDPFFTTKEKGRGTGLGLASAYGIIKNHGGFITVDSWVGQGSVFAIFLPASDKRLPGAPHKNETALGGEGVILLVDDEPVTLEVGQKMLERLGYTVITADSGASAIECFQSQGADIDLVVLDMIMPGMGGGETYDRLKALSPEVKVLLSSGYSIDGEATDILDRGCDGFIQKPFDLANLSRKIKDILSGTAKRSA